MSPRHEKFVITDKNLLRWLSVAVLAGASIASAGCDPNHPLSPVVDDLLDSVVDWSSKTGESAVLVKRVKAAYDSGNYSTCVNLLQEAASAKNLDGRLDALRELLEVKIEAQLKSTAQAASLEAGAI